jgi:hypothetical protein
VEFYIVALFALLPLLLGTLQVSLLLVANHHVDFAAFAAARRGAVANGDPGAIREGFIQGIIPLFSASDEPLDRSNVAVRVARAYAVAAVDVALHARFTTLAPSAAAQRDFAVERERRRVIPNDAINSRGSGIGAASGQTLLEASLLKVEVSYCHPLIVPFARQMLIAALRALDHDPWHHLCYLSGRVPLRSVGITPMQSDFWVR